MHAPFAGALSVIDRYLRFGLALQNDADLRRSIIGEEGRVSFRLPADTGWMTLGKSSFELSRAKPLPTSERAFSELVQDAAIAKQILQGTGARAHASKSEHLIRKGLLQSDRPPSGGWRPGRPFLRLKSIHLAPALSSSSTICAPGPRWSRQGRWSARAPLLAHRGHSRPSNASFDPRECVSLAGRHGAKLPMGREIEVCGAR